jgi:peptidoglycan/LPS O-acetylase OafA/YrhL
VTAFPTSPLSRFVRQTSSGRFIPEIDGLRFVSIAWVVLFHLSGFVQVANGVPTEEIGTGGAMERVLSTGHYGVQLFFMISGFVLALPFAQHRLTGASRVDLRAYFLRRVTRLEPPYIIAMVLFAALLVVRNHVPVGQVLPHLAASLGYVHNVVYGEGSTINVVAWSLEIEVQFYILAPLLCSIFLMSDARVRRAILAAGILTASVLQALYMEPDTRWWLSLGGHIQYFLVGLLLADIYVADWRQAPESNPWWDAVSLVGWPLLAYVWLHTRATTLLFPWFGLALFCAAFRGRWSRQVFRAPLIVVIGGMCYTIYLLHYPLLAAVGRMLHFHFIVAALIFVPVLLLVSGAYFLLIERPCMDKRWPQKLWKRLSRS